MEELRKLLEKYMDQNLERLILSAPRKGREEQKVRIRPVLLKGQLKFQAEIFRGTQAFHENMSREEAAARICGWMEDTFCQMQMSGAGGDVTALVSKKGRVTVKEKRRPGSGGPEASCVNKANLEHNRKKAYLLEEGTPVPFLADLGVMTAEGRVVRARYDKFRQINRFLEFIEDILPRLDRERENVIIDFGCGKSYLTFAMYYYLKELKGYSIRVIGLDLKKDVIARCNLLAERYGFDRLRFYHGDIASYEGVDQVDMVVTLHACDTATDYALSKAVKWGARVILSVPCCQHELNGQMENELLAPLFSYGIIKERTAALFTDAIRAELLESQGYRTQLLEFIDMEHTPKNILIRAVKQGGRKDNRRQLEEILTFLHGDLTLYRLLCGEEEGTDTRDPGRKK